MVSYIFKELKFLPTCFFSRFLFVVCCFFLNTFSKNCFMNAIRVVNSLDPDQARHFVGPDLGLNCLRKLSTDTNRQRVTVVPSKSDSDLILWYSC